LSTIKNAKIQRAFLKSKECGFNFGHKENLNKASLLR